MKDKCYIHFCAVAGRLWRHGSCRPYRDCQQLIQNKWHSQQHSSLDLSQPSQISPTTGTGMELQPPKGSSALYVIERRLLCLYAGHTMKGVDHLHRPLSSFPSTQAMWNTPPNSNVCTLRYLRTRRWWLALHALPFPFSVHLGTTHCCPIMTHPLAVWSGAAAHIVRCCLQQTARVNL